MKTTTRTPWLFLTLLGACGPAGGSLDSGLPRLPPPPPSAVDAGITATDAGFAADAQIVVDAGTADSGAIADAGRPQLPVQSGIEVQTALGRIRGKDDGNLRVFRGIPFAEPPVGNLRFRPPEPKKPWVGTLEAYDYGPSCPQTKLGPEFILGNFAGPQDEDCLSLNVWAHKDLDQRPVMVFIYGGGFVVGGSSWPLYEGKRLAERGDIVLVTINYRLGVLGYLATDELAQESIDGSSGNYGLRDQIEALRWVRDNITAFGGDPNNVTVFGESAGAVSVCSLLGSPTADGLYHKAIIESGLCELSKTRSNGSLNVPPSHRGGQQLVEKLGCAGQTDVNQCLRDLDLKTLTDAASISSILGGDLAALSALSPTVDGILIPKQPIERLRSGDIDVPLIAGSNKDEGILFVVADTILTWRNFRDAVADFVGSRALADDIVELYPVRKFPLPIDAWIAFMGEITFICHGLAAADAARTGQPAYSYHFTHSPLLTRIAGSAHAIELMYVFDTFDKVALIPTSVDRRLINEMQVAWSSFARTGQPTLPGGWPAFNNASSKVSVLGRRNEVQNHIRDRRCRELKKLGLTP